MKLGSLKDMIKDYERRTGETVDLSGFYWDGDYHDDYNEHFKFFPEVGFVFWNITEKDGVRYLVILQTYGIFKKMCDYLRAVMKANNLTEIITYTTRNPKVHARRWGMKWLKKYDYIYEGRKYHVMLSDINHLDK